MIYKNKKLILSLALIILIIIVSTVSLGSPSWAADFSDIDNHWAKSYIENIASNNAISGYPDKTFKPNNNITRIEFIAIILKSQGIHVGSVSQDEYWGQPYIEAALKNHLITHDEYGDINKTTLEKNISREEMASIIVNAYVQSRDYIDHSIINKEILNLKDLDNVSPKYYKNVVASIKLNFITGYPDGTFAPQQETTRAEAAILSYRFLVKLGVIKEGELKENIIVSKTRLEQGDILKMTAYHVSDPSTILLDQNLNPDFQWYEDKDLLNGYIATNYNTKPGKYSIKFTNTETGNVTTKDIEIFAREFRVQHLKVDSSIESSTRTDEANEEYRKYFNPSRDISSPVKYYTEPFILPTKGRLTTEFGESRTVNGAKTSYRHAGLDIAAPLGTEVLAVNTGKVTLAMPLILTGNSIVIDHGEGIFSIYFHLDKLFVTEGELVERGQLIGEVGTTGFSTGPHLHFAMSHYRSNIEPGYIIYDQSITKNNYLELMN